MQKYRYIVRFILASYPYGDTGSISPYTYTNHMKTETNGSMYPQLLIGLIGKKGSGKSTCADILSRRSGWNIKELSFAKSLKDMGEICGVSRQHMEDPTLKEKHYESYGKTPRKIMQDLGTYCRENFGQDIFIRYVENIITKHPGSYVISDCRYPNEAAMIKRNGGILIRIERADLKGSDTHSSETELEKIKYDYLIKNDGDLNDLEHQIVAVVDRHIARSLPVLERIWPSNFG